MELIIRQEGGVVSTDRVKELVDSFISSRDVKKSSKLLYRRTLKQYFNWVEKKGYLLSEIARPQLLEYKEELLSSNKRSLTVGSYIASLRLFYEWTEANKYYPNVAKGIKTPKRKRQFKKQPLLPEQATTLLSYYQGKELRNYAIVNLLLRTGLRTIEVARAKVEDITFKASQRVLLIKGKGRDEKDNFVILTDKTYLPIKEYLSSRAKISPSEPLFTSESNNSSGEALTTRSISYIAKTALKGIGLNERSFTAHSLRHTTAVNILRAGGSLESAQFTLRHSNPATTQIYTATLDEERRLQNSGEALIDSMY
jgi:integrase/recombinase XerC/integrase/recombinase XerD